jgi:hypothetical protein
MKFTLENDFSPSLWNQRGEENGVQGEIVVPFEAFAKQNLFRIKMHTDSEPMALTLRSLVPLNHSSVAGS